MSKKFIICVLIIYLVIFAIFVSTINNSSDGEKTILTITNRKYDMFHTSAFDYEENGETVSVPIEYHLSRTGNSSAIVNNVQKYKILESEKIIILIGKQPYHQKEEFKYFVLNYESDICNYYNDVEDIIEIDARIIEKDDWLIPHHNS